MNFLDLIKPLKIFFLFCLILISNIAFGHITPRKHCKKSDFFQGSTPLLSFGQNILPRNDISLLAFSSNVIAKNNHAVSLSFEAIYGILDDLSVLLEVPVAVSYLLHGNITSSLGDTTAQFEYALFEKQGDCSNHQGTIVANMSFPTGLRLVSPPTGFGAITFFGGFTYNYSNSNIFFYTSDGVTVPTQYHGLQYGSQIIYQTGIGRRILNDEDLLLAWMLEFSGVFSFDNKLNGRVVKDSGGNSIYLMPSLSLTVDSWMFLFGTGYSLQQTFFGNQERLANGKSALLINGGIVKTF